VEVLCANRSAAHWVHRDSRVWSSFKVHARDIFDPPFTRSDKRPSSSFLAQLLFRVPSFVHLAVHLAMLGFTCPWVSFPLRDITRARLRLFAEPPTLHFVPSAGFRNLSTASSALELAGLFHPAATSRVLYSFRGFSPSAADLPHRKIVSSLPLLHRRSYPRSDFRRLACTSTCDASRLRGFYLCKAAFYESGYSPRPHPLPSSVSSPPGHPFSRRQCRFTQHVPLMMFSSLGLHALRLFFRPVGLVKLAATLRSPQLRSLRSPFGALRLQPRSPFGARSPEPRPPQLAITFRRPPL